MSTRTDTTSADGDQRDTTARDDAESTTSSTPSQTEDVSGELSKDVIFDLLRVQRRRDVMWYLDTGSGEATLSDLAEHIAAKENDCDVVELSSDQRKRVYVALYQCHLPKMDEAGVVDFDRQRGTIERESQMAQILPYLYLDRDDRAETGLLSRFSGLTRSVYSGLFD